MGQSPASEASRCSASQEVPCILWNPNVHYCIIQQPITSPYTEPNQSNPSPHPTSSISILIISSDVLLGLPSGPFPSGFPTKTLYATLFSPIHAKCNAHQILLDLIIQIIFDEEYVSLSFLLCSFLSTPLLPRPSYVQIFSSAPYSQTPLAYVLSAI